MSSFFEPSPQWSYNRGTPVPHIATTGPPIGVRDLVADDGPSVRSQ